MTYSDEKRNRRIALFTSLGIHGVLFLLFLFLMAWKAPNPPAPEYGVEINFGLDHEGGGDIQPDVPVKADEQVAEQPSKEDEQLEKSDPIKEIVKEQPVEEVITSKEPGPVVVKKEVKKEVKELVKDPVKEKPKEETKNLEADKTHKTEPVKELKSTEVKKGTGVVSQGDDPGKVGDKGDPKGKIDAQALYGKPGGGVGGNGFGLKMSGWVWADEPRIPKLPDNDSGRIVFEIECDENGDIVGIKTLEQGLSPEAEQILKREIRKNSLIRTSSGQAPERSTGQVVFILRTK